MVYEDEVDIDLNPKIDTDWMRKGQQKRTATPGQNQKHYLAGALHSGTGRIPVTAATVLIYLIIYIVIMINQPHYLHNKKYWRWSNYHWICYCYS